MPDLNDPPAEFCNKTKRKLWLANLPEGFWQIGTHQTCVHNERRALRNRVAMKVKGATKYLINILETQVDMFADQLGVNPIGTYEELVGMFPPSRRKMYRRALDSLKAFAGEDQALARVSSFVKAEKLKILEKDGDPRLIQARTKEFNLKMGMYTRAVEKSLYGLKDPIWLQRGLSRSLLAKGQSMEGRAKLLRQAWKSYKKPASLSLDLSRWDAHVGKPMLEVMHRFYLRLMPDPVLKNLLKFQLENRGTTQNGLKYKNPGGVTSGDMTTALGNCVAVCAIVVSLRQALLIVAGKTVKGKHEETFNEKLLLWEKSRPLPDDPIPMIRSIVTRYLNTAEKREEFVRSNPMSIVDDGDDHVLITEAKWAPMLAEVLPVWWKAAGHVMKVEGETQKFHKIEFCQHKPIKLSSGIWTMCPDPYKVIATATVVAGNNQLNWARYLMTIWEARALLHRGVPLLGPLFTAWSKLGWSRERLSDDQLRQSASGIDHLMGMNKLKQQNRPTLITPEQRVMFEDQWGISVEEQLQMERWKISRPTHFDQTTSAVKTTAGLLHCSG